MKKISVLLIALLASAMTFMTSCDDDDIDFAAPVITFENGDQTVAQGSDVTISGEIYAPGEIKQIIYFKDNASFGDAVTGGFDTDTTTYFSITVPGDQVTETFTFEVQVTDKQDKIGKGSVTVTVDDIISKGTDIKVYCAAADQYTDELSFASLTDFTTYSWSTAADNVSNIDLLYYNGSYTKTNGTPHFASPDYIVINDYDPDIVIHNDEAPAGAKTTYFKVLSDEEAANFADWDAIDDDSAISTITDINNVNVSFETGDIIAFKLADGKQGVIRPADAVDGNGNGYYYDPVDYITFDVIVQKQAPAK
ncbi:MAG: hypothetical protein GXO50_09210 [Chlorobi bacterium]|nr:hypothetical protein [Chlorobiota bacterium]